MISTQLDISEKNCDENKNNLFYRNENKPFLIGKNPCCDISIFLDKFLSDFQCALISKRNNKWFIKDGNENKSEFGTW